MPPFRRDSGSFRDRANCVYDDGSRIVRGISEEALRNWSLLRETPFFRDLKAEGKIVGTESCVPTESGLPGIAERWHGYLSHERVPFVSYPYEWSFGMLKDAALLHLDMLERAIPQGWTLKDASAYNVQWIGASPVFIDVPSFEPYRKGDPWVGYRQFCMMFLYPLMLKAYKGIDYLPFLRGSLEGIDPQTADRILRGATRFRKGVFWHVCLHSKLERKYAARDLEQARALTEGSGRRPIGRTAVRHSEAMIMGTIQGLRRTVGKLDIPETRTTWGNYDTDHSYAESSFAAKKAFVESCVLSRRRRMTWDIGCNTGTFSQLAARNADYVVAVDGDTKAIERLYQNLKGAGARNILPLVMNIGNVSPDQGWRGSERKALERRGRPDLILCLALIHHMVISSNIPAGEFIGWLREFDAEVVLEWVGPDDDMTKMLLRNRVDQYGDLSAEIFERIVAEQFVIVKAEPLKGGTRKIYHLVPR
jgi:SAM-dependent methyltransferase